MIDSVELTVSCVLFNTEPAEVDRMIRQVASVPLKTHLYLIDNSPGIVAGSRTDGDVTIVATGANLGYGRAHNIAIRESRGRSRFHLISNTDIEFDGTDIPKLLDVLEHSPNVGMIAPRVRYPDGNLQHLCRLLPRPMDLVARRFFCEWRWARMRNSRYELREWNYDEDMEVPFISGCFMLVRRDILDKVDGFDERFFLYFEDTDLSRRINCVSTTLFTPRVEIVHQYRSKSARSPRLLRYLLVSGIKYFMKWGWWRDPHREAVNERTLSRIAASQKSTH